MKKNKYPITNQDLTIRLASIADAPLISCLAIKTFKDTFAYCFRDPKDLENYLLSTFNVTKIKSSLSKRNNRYFIASSQELPVAYAKLKIDSTNEQIPFTLLCQLQKIYVLADYQGSKIGYLLQEEVFKSARATKQKHIWLSVYDNNQRAIQFYLKNGFTKAGNHPFQIGKENFNFLILVKTLI